MASAMAAGPAAAAPSFQYFSLAPQLRVMHLADSTPPPAAEVPAPVSAVLSASASSMTLATIPTTTVSQSVTLTNTGVNGSLTLNGVSLSGAAADKFTVAGTCSAGAVLPANGGTCSATVTFTPGAGAGVAGQNATLTVTHSGTNGAQAIALTGDSSYAPAVPAYPSGAIASISGYTATWGASAGYGGVSVGTTFRKAGKFIVAFTGTPANLSALEYNVQDPVGGYYAVSMATGTVVKSGAQMTGGSANGTKFTRPTLVSGDRIVMLADFDSKSVYWYRCSMSTCDSTPFHTASNVTTSGTMRLYLWKPNSGAVSVTYASAGITPMPVSTGFHNGLPQ
jgi:hypothetical protein